MTGDSLHEASRMLSLTEIASWHPGVCCEVTPPIMASVPALQRGLVWRPQQIELLWDSILRGFPIGALVVCPKIERQERGHDPRVTHHLLDGQQRCNAIALGFNDPFSPEKQCDVGEVGSVLWLDLEPELDRNSTRNYLVRVTTMAHPWGYKKNDEADTLSTWAIRNSLEGIGRDPAAPDYQRPAPLELWPFDAVTPVPLSWLTLAWSEAGEDVFWSRLAERANAVGFRWKERVQRLCGSKSPAALAQKNRTLRGIRRALTAKLTVLSAPTELLEASQQEKASATEAEDVTNIEQLFQRLNQQGTRLDGEELSYSMIKAYWPDLADPIDRIANKRMPQSRMVSLGVRAALARQNSEKKVNLPAHPAVRSIRDIAVSRPASRRAIHNFIDTRLEDACGLVDRWLKYDRTSNPQGLLPVLVTSIAMESRDVYLLLLCFASRMLEDQVEDKRLLQWRIPLQALATVLHWFSVDKTKATNFIYQHCGSNLTPQTLREALQGAVKAGYVHPVHSPSAVRRFLGGEEDLLQLSTKKFQEWRRVMLVYRNGDDDGNARRKKQWDGFLNVIFRKRELLLHAQRHFLAERFPDYDPARRDLWDEHNRPWDFDHILASKFVYNRRDKGPFRAVSNEWAILLGNLRAWPFEDNRSEKDQVAREKIPGTREEVASFLDGDEVGGFSVGDAVRWEKDAAQKFIAACRKRLVRIYAAWHESMEVAELFKQP